MGAAAYELRRPQALDGREREEALEASRIVSQLAASRRAVHVEAKPDDGGNPQSFVLPAQAVQLLMDLLVHLGEGNPATVIPDHAEFTTQQAADFLNVSRPYVIKLIEGKKLQCRMVGTHRRVLFVDLKRFKDDANTASMAALDALAEDAQAHGEYE